MLLFRTLTYLFIWLCVFSIIICFFICVQKTKNTNERNAKKNKEKESEDEEEDKNDGCYIKQRDEPLGTSKHLQKKTKKLAKKQAKVGFDKYFTYINKALATYGKK